MGKEHSTKQTKCIGEKKKKKTQKNRSEPGLQKKKVVSRIATVKCSGGKTERWPRQFTYSLTDHEKDFGFDFKYDGEPWQDFKGV